MHAPSVKTSSLGTTPNTHSGIGYMTPHSVHYGTAQAIHTTRQTTLDGAFLAHPNRREGGPDLEVSSRLRKPGGGRKRLSETDPQLNVELDRLVAPAIQRARARQDRPGAASHCSGGKNNLGRITKRGARTCARCCSRARSRRS
jgi:hypothetical protein